MGKGDGSLDELKEAEKATARFERFRMRRVHSIMDDLGHVHDLHRMVPLFLADYGVDEVRDYAEFYLDHGHDGFPHVVGAAGELLTVVRDASVATGGEMKREAVERLFVSCLMYLCHEQRKKGGGQ